MNDFFKRMSWRLTGGIVTIALGAFAAAQAQKQDFDDSQGLIAEQSMPSLDTPAWSNSLPIPIEAGPEQNPGQGPGVLPAGFSMGSPASSFVTQVNHEEENPPAPAMQMPLPEKDLSAEMPAEMASGPSMFMPSMGMPEVAATEQPSQELAAESMQPAVQMGLPMAGQLPTAEPAMVESAPMPEIQFEQGPSMAGYGGPTAEMSPAMEAPIEPSIAQPDMAMPSPATTPQNFAGNGFAGDGVVADNGGYGEGPAMNSLRDEVPYDAPSQYEPAQPYSPQPQYPEPQYDVAAQREMLLPSLPQPSQPVSPSQPAQYAGQDGMNYGQPDAGYTNERFDGSVPSRFAGHQQMGLPRGVGGGVDNGGPNGPPSNYLQDRNDPIATSLPGDRSLEGVQTPSVVIHKRAPAEVKVGKPATFVIQVRNVGSAEALNVEVHDQIPTGMQLVDATPQPLNGTQNGSLVWQLGSMPAGDERAITMQLVAREEGELGSVARVTFEAAASVRTRSTRPELKITQRAPQKVLIGQQLEIELEISNIGTGEATGVILQEDVPEGLDHPRGRQLDNALGALRPGETRREILRLRAVQPGMIRNVVHLVAEDAQEVTHSVDVEVVAPALGVRLTGPNRRFLERQATYMVDIQNAGTAPATNVEVIAYLDRGFTFVSTENNGHYDSNRHAVLWSIVNLPPGDSGSVPLTLMPVEQGEQAIRLEAIADLDTRAQSESTVSVESQAELTFSIADTADPIELGSETVYEIRVKNSGSRNDTNVQVRMIMPPGIELLESDTEHQNDGRGGVIFAPQKNLASGGDLIYRVRARGVQPDTHIIKAIVTSDQARVPVTKEESTMVYADR